ncbi:MAG TPA: Gfo/Idh/MocA family oxidoreductase [Limnochordia bacterium]
MAKTLGVGLIGYKFMGKSHSHAFRDVSMFFDLPAKPVMKAICGRDEAAVRRAAEQWGWEGIETDWRRLVSRKDIDIIDISAPGDVHAEMAIGAAQAGKHIICEKPLANTLAEAKEMLAAVQKAGVKHMVAFNYRRVPAVQLARQLIQEGAIGKIYHFRGTYLQDWIVDPEFPLVWRLQKDKAGSGPLGDLGAHVVDLARFLVGEITEVVGMAETFIKERPLVEDTDAGLGAKGGQRKGEVTVEDAAVFLGRFQNGALGSFEATRFAPGRRNYNRFEINGSEGSLAFNLERLNELEFYSRRDPAHAQGFRTIIVNEGVHPYMSAWWPPGHIIGWEHTFVHEVKDFIEAVVNDTSVYPDFVDGVQCQAVLDAVERSVANRQWVRVEDFTGARAG